MREVTSWFDRANFDSSFDFLSPMMASVISVSSSAPSSLPASAIVSGTAAPTSTSTSLQLASSCSTITSSSTTTTSSSSKGGNGSSSVRKMTSHSSVTSMSTKFTNLVGKARRRPPSAPWYTLPQPVPLVKIASQTSTHSDGCSNTRYIANGITPEAQNILSQLPAPLYIVAFTGFGRSGKSYTASKLREHLTGDNKHQFADAPGNVTCTHGIDMMVFKHTTKDGHFVFLDCEGGANHNQSALPFVIGLAARLATSLYVFERGCFTTNGLDTVMQIINMVNNGGGWMGESARDRNYSHLLRSF